LKPLNHLKAKMIAIYVRWSFTKCMVFFASIRILRWLPS
jgi:hypothetical protein